MTQVWNHNPFEDDLIGSFEVGVEGVAENALLQRKLREPTWYAVDTGGQIECSAVYSAGE